MVYSTDDLTITTGKVGATEYAKVSYPIRYGVYDEVRTQDHVFQFNLHGEIKHISGRRREWPNPSEWLKRSRGNDWTYYSSGDYNGVIERFGEYYFPCFPYQSNSIMADRPFEYGAVRQALKETGALRQRLLAIGSGPVPSDIRRFLDRVTKWDEDGLAGRAKRFHAMIGGRISVLPPDARHADYDVVPLIIADGCLYNCRFCTVKSGRGLAVRSRENVLAQIADLKAFHGPEMRNHNALFLGQHDALAAGGEMIESACETAYDSLGFEDSLMKRPALFLFGSVHALLKAKESLFRALNAMPFCTYINIGLESADGATLARLGKPISEASVRDAFARMLDVNRHYDRIEVSANLVIGLDLPASHLSSLVGLANSGPPCGRGTLYVSPLVRDGAPGLEENRALMGQFDGIKAESSLPTYLYLIQRL